MDLEGGMSKMRVDQAFAILGLGVNETRDDWTTILLHFLYRQAIKW
jgi:hypothetical protein